MWQDWMDGALAERPDIAEMLRDPWTTPYVLSFDGIRMYR